MTIATGDARIALLEGGCLQSLILLTGLMLGFTCAAEATYRSLQPIDGTFIFSGEIHPQQVIQNERVNVSTRSGRSRRGTLESQGFVCARTISEVYHCSRYIKLGVLPNAVTERIEKRASLFRLRIKPLNYPPVLRVYDQSYLEWHVPAAVFWGEHSYDFYRLHWIDGNYEISFGDHDMLNYVSLTYSQGEFFVLIQEVLNESTHRWTQFVVQVRLQPLK